MKYITIGILILVLAVFVGACCTAPGPVASVAASLTPTPTLAATACDRLAFAGGSGVYIVNVDGSGLAHVADAPSGYAPTDLQWSPDGKRLAYLNAKVGNPWEMSLYVVDTDRIDQRLLADDPGGWTDYGWSPDSQYIWTEYCSRSWECTFFLQLAETGEGICNSYYLPTQLCASECFPLRLSDGRWWASNRNWARMMVVASEDHLWALCPELGTVGYSGGLLSSDEKWVAFGAWDSIDAYSWWHIARSNGDELRMLYAEPFDEFCGHAGAWSPDAKSFAFATYEGDEILVWTANPIEKAESLVARLEGRECPEDIKWSADSRHISLLVDDYDNGGSGHIVRMCTVSVPDGEVNCFPLSGVSEEYSWSPDGHWLACARADLAVLLSIDGEQIDLTAKYTRGIEWSPTGRWLAFSTDEYPLIDGDGEGLYVFDLVTRATVQLSDERVPGFAFSPSCK